MDMSTIKSWELDENILTVTEIVDLSNLPKLSLFVIGGGGEDGGVDFRNYGNTETKEFSISMTIPYPARQRLLKKMKEKELALRDKNDATLRELADVKLPDFKFFLDCIQLRQPMIGHCDNEIQWVSIQAMHLLFEPSIELPTSEDILQLLRTIFVILKSESLESFVGEFEKFEYIDLNVTVLVYDSVLEQYVTLPLYRHSFAHFQTTKLPDSNETLEIAPIALSRFAHDRPIELIKETDSTRLTRKIINYFPLEFIQREITPLLNDQEQQIVRSIFNTTNKKYQFVIESILFRLLDLRIWPDTKGRTRQLIESLYLRHMYSDRMQLHFGKIGDSRPYINLYPEMEILNRSWRNYVLKNSSESVKGQIATVQDVLTKPKLQFYDNPVFFLNWQARFIHTRILPAIKEEDQALFKERLKRWRHIQTTLLLSLYRFANTDLFPPLTEEEEEQGITRRVPDLYDMFVEGPLPITMASKYTSR